MRPNAFPLNHSQTKSAIFLVILDPIPLCVAITLSSDCVPLPSKSLQTSYVYGPLWQRSNVELAGVRARVPGHHDFPSSIAPPSRPGQPVCQHSSIHLPTSSNIRLSLKEEMISSFLEIFAIGKTKVKPQIFCSQNAFLLPFDSWNTVLGFFLKADSKL